MIYWELPGELDIHNVAVHPRFRRQGIARAMLADIIEGATKRGFPAHDARSPQVQRPGADPVSFARFSRSAAMRKGYYSDNGEGRLGHGAQARAVSQRAPAKLTSLAN